MSTPPNLARGSIQLVKYAPSLFQVLDAVPGRPQLSKLRHQSFLHWYYASSEHCHLHLVLDRDQQCLACQGRELMPFRIGERQLKVACLSSFYAFRPGFGFYAFAACMQGCDAGLLLGGTEQARGFAARSKWSLEQIRAFSINNRHSEIGGGLLRVWFKKLANRLSQRSPLGSLRGNLPGDLKGIRVAERAAYEASLLEFTSAFHFRFDPDITHLAWRYALDLPFMRYHLFQAYSGTTYIGYVILQDTPQGLLVAQADGIEPRLTAAAVVHAISAIAKSEVDGRQVILLTSHTAMRDVYESVGFRHRPGVDKPMALGTAKGPVNIPIPSSGWLVNYDWGDRGLTRPFLDEAGS